MALQAFSYVKAFFAFHASNIFPHDLVQHFKILFF